MNCSVFRGEFDVYRRDLIREVDHDSALSRFLEIMGTPEGDWMAQAEWFEPEWAKFTDALPADAALYLFQSSKGALGHDEGIVAVQGCKALAVLMLAEQN